VSPSRAGATSISKISAGHHAPTWCASSTTTRPNRSPIHGAHDDALAYVATVTGATTCSPSPSRPIGCGVNAASVRDHWSSSTRVGTRQSVATPSRAIAASATSVLPAPVGSVTTPRAPTANQRSSAASWYHRSGGSVHVMLARRSRSSSDTRTPAAASCSSIPA